MLLRQLQTSGHSFQKQAFQSCNLVYHSPEGYTNINIVTNTHVFNSEHCLIDSTQHHQMFRAAVLNPGRTWIDFRWSVNIDGGDYRYLFSPTSKWNVAFHSTMNACNKTIYGLWTPKMFINFNKPHYLKFTQTYFPGKGSVGFTRPSKGSRVKKKNG
jgi:hypothetical protein